jgi:Transmembrane secretion effector
LLYRHYGNTGTVGRGRLSHAGARVSDAEAGSFEDLPAVSALSSLRGATAAIAGPALAGVLIATVGLPFTFGADVASYAMSLIALVAIRAMPAGDQARPVGIASIVEGFRYAASRPELIGT